MANDLTFNQISAVLNQVIAQATGISPAAVVDTSSFITAGQEALKAGYDTLGTAISQVLGRTIFSNRPYGEKLRGLEMTQQQWGMMTRKLSPIDKPFTDDESIDPTKLIDGASIDPYKISKPMTQQMNYFGFESVSKPLTVWDWQLNQAFQGPDDFSAFIAMMMQNASDMLAQARENCKRMTLVNLIAAIIGNYPAQRVQLVTAYNAYLGGAAETWATIKASPAKYQHFMRFAYAKIATVTSMLTERSAKFHVSMPGKIVMRHTPYEMQRLYMLGQERYDMEAQVLADAFHDNYLKYADVETVNFWQSIDTPDAIDVTPSYLETAGVNAGTIQKGAEVSASGIFAVLTDREAAGVCQMNERVKTVYNGNGEYTNYFWKNATRYFNDFTENAVVFTLD